jgi:hypothetical protein
MWDVDNNDMLIQCEKSESKSSTRWFVFFLSLPIDISNKITMWEVTLYASLIRLRLVMLSFLLMRMLCYRLSIDWSMRLCYSAEVCRFELNHHSQWQNDKVMCYAYRNAFGPKVGNVYTRKVRNDMGASCNVVEILTFYYNLLAETIFLRKTQSFEFWPEMWPTNRLWLD